MKIIKWFGSLFISPPPEDVYVEAAEKAIEYQKRIHMESGLSQELCDIVIFESGYIPENRVLH